MCLQAVSGHLPDDGDSEGQRKPWSIPRGRLEHKPEPNEFVFEDGETEV